MSYTRVGVVTGANKGVGYGIVRQLALQYPKSPLNNGPLLIYLTARDKSRGEAAVKSLQEDQQIKAAQALKSDGGLFDVKFHALDITDRSSIKSFAEDLKQSHPEGIDFVINNAGIALDGFDYNVVKETHDCNYYATMEASHAWLPLLKEDGRLVNVASTAGSLQKYSAENRQRFLESKTEADVTTLMREFAEAVKEGQEKAKGWPSQAYSTSKAGLIGATKALARAEQEKGRKFLINSCCPGYVNTDMTKGNGTKTIDEGAQTPVLLALADLQGQTGTFWRSENVIDWKDL